MNEQHLHLLAQDPSTDRRSLEALAAHPSEAIQRALVSNPSTPLEILMSLGAKLPSLLLENVIFPLLLLEDPTLSTIPAETLAALARLPAFPAGTLASLAHHRDWCVQEAVASNPNTPQETLLALLEDADIDSSRTVESNPSVPQAHLKLLQRARLLVTGVTRKVDGKTHREESDEPPLSSEEMTRLFSQGEQSRSWLACCPRLPLSMIESLLASSDVGIRASLGSNPATPPSILLELAADSSVYVSSRIAPRADLPREVMERLLASPHAHIRSTLANNVALPVEFLEVLAGDPEAEVRRRVAESRALPEHLAQRLIHDKDAEVRCRLAANQTASASTLCHLAGDRAREVRLRAAENPNTPQEFLSLMQRALQQEDNGRVTADLTLSEDELERLSRSGPLARAMVARHPATTDELRWRLLAQSDTHQALARSPFTPGKLLLHLSDLPEEESRFWVATNARCPAEILGRLASDRCAGVRKAVAANQRTPHSALQALSRDVSAFVRYGLTQNPAAPAELLEVLQGDATHYVSYWAKQRAGKAYGSCAV